MDVTVTYAGLASIVIGLIIAGASYSIIEKKDLS